MKFTGINHMEAQEVFDKVVAHLRTQGKPARTGSQCWYRINQDGGDLRCAVGVLIKDEEYTNKMEEQGVRSLLTNWGKKARSVAALEPHVPLLVGLQDAHDSWHPELDGDRGTEGMVKAFIDIAVHHELDPKLAYDWKDELAHA